LLRREATTAAAEIEEDMTAWREEATAMVAMVVAHEAALDEAVFAIADANQPTRAKADAVRKMVAQDDNDIDDLFDEDNDIFDIDDGATNLAATA
jgi:hypothetical protein